MSGLMRLWKRRDQCMTVPFDDESLRRVASRREHKVRSVVLPSCGQRTDDMFIQLVHEYATPGIDNFGFVLDGIWRIRVRGLPDRWIRMWQGYSSMNVLLTKYSLLGPHGCTYGLNASETTRRNVVVYNKSKRGGGGTGIDPEPLLPSVAEKEKVYVVLCAADVVRLEDVPCYAVVRNVGIPQRTQDSGICWWGAMWFAIEFNKACHTTLHFHLNGSDSSVAAKVSKIIPTVLQNPHESEELRKVLWNAFRLGDNPNQDPRLDGKNGYLQFMYFCYHLNIPLISLVYNPTTDEVVHPGASQHTHKWPRAPRPNEPAFLGIRTYRSKFRPKIIFHHAGIEWKLRSAMIGSELCQHQVAIASADTRTQHHRWAMYDSDAVRVGIGPTSWEVTGGENEWWTVMDKMIPITNDNGLSKLCILSPYNDDPMLPLMKSLSARSEQQSEYTDLFANSSSHLVNVDWIYTSH